MEELKSYREKFFDENQKRLDEYIAEKRFEEAAILAVNQAFLTIPPEEFTKLLIDAIKEWKAKHP